MVYFYNVWFHLQIHEVCLAGDPEVTKLIFNFMKTVCLESNAFWYSFRILGEDEKAKFHEVTYRFSPNRRLPCVLDLLQEREAIFRDAQILYSKYVQITDIREEMEPGGVGGGGFGGENTMEMQQLRKKTTTNKRV